MALIQIALEIISIYKPLEIPIKSELKNINAVKIFSEKTTRSFKKNLISNSEKNQLLKNFKASIDGYTYFEN